MYCTINALDNKDFISSQRKLLCSLHSISDFFLFVISSLTLLFLHVPWSLYSETLSSALSPPCGENMALPFSEKSGPGTAVRGRVLFSNQH